MNELLNDDGTPSFQTIGQLRDNFETEFAKKELGAAMTNIVVKATPERNDRSSVFDDDNIKALLSTYIPTASNYVSFPHSHKTNVLFISGRVAPVSWSEMKGKGPYHTPYGNDLFYYIYKGRG